MSYLNLPNGVPGFNKAVISLWFRIPHTSIAAAAAEATSPATILPHLIPLFAFGQPQVAKGLAGTVANISDLADAFGPTVFDTVAITETGVNEPVDPCYIAIDCSGAEPVLAFNIQMADTAHTISGLSIAGAAIHSFTPLTVPASPPIADLLRTTGSGWSQRVELHVGLPHTYYMHCLGLTDFSNPEYTYQPEFFRVKTSHAITSDQWHHLLLSFDLSAPCLTSTPPPGPIVEEPTPTTPHLSWNTIAEGTSSYCKLWYAIDDVDYRGGSNMGPYAVDYKIADGSSGVGDPNGILTSLGWQVAQVGISTLYNLWQDRGIYSYDPSPIPSSAAPLGLPAPASYVDHVHHVEMAELQVWTGVTLDTGIEDYRRLFVDDNGKPVNPSEANHVLGQPLILLHKSANWIKGKNTGSFDEGMSPAGDFFPTGTIKRYIPDPSLHGAQGAPQSARLSKKLIDAL